MTGTDTTATADVTAQVEALAADLGERGFVTNVSPGGRYPRLTVISRSASHLSDNIYAAPTQDGSWWFWWSWAERIADVAHVATAAQAIAHVLRAGDAR